MEHQSREHAVKCALCRKRWTWSHDALCEYCVVMLTELPNHGYRPFGAIHQHGGGEPAHPSGDAA